MASLPALPPFCHLAQGHPLADDWGINHSHWPPHQPTSPRLFVNFLPLLLLLLGVNKFFDSFWNPYVPKITKSTSWGFFVEKNEEGWMHFSYFFVSFFISMCTSSLHISPTVQKRIFHDANYQPLITNFPPFLPTLCRPVCLCTRYHSLSHCPTSMSHLHFFQL